MRWLSCIVFTVLVTTAVAQTPPKELPEFTFTEERKLSEFRQSSLDSLQIEQYQGKSLGDLLNAASFVFIKDYGPGQIASSSIRGSNAAHTSVFWNGLQLNAPSLGQVDFSIIPVQPGMEVDVLHGNSSLSQGFGGIGGAIYIDQNAAFSSNKVFASHQFGSFKEHISIVGTQLTNDTTSFQLAVQRNSAKNDFEFSHSSLQNDRIYRRTNNAFQQYSGTASVQHQLNSNNQLTLNALVAQTHREIPPNITSLLESEETQQDFVSALGFGWNQERKKWNFITHLGLVYSELTYQNEVASIKSTTENANYQASFQAKHSFSSSAFWQAKWLNQLESVKSAGYGTTQQRLRSGLLLEYAKYFTQQFKLQALLRPEIAGEDYTFFLPAITLTYQPQLYSNIQLTTSFAKNVHYPTLNDWYWNPGGNPDLAKEENETIELGVQLADSLFQFLGLTTQITGYWGNTKNWIQWVPTDNIWQAQNVKDVAQQGLEASASIAWQAAGKWQVKGLYSRTLTVDESSDRQLIYVPENQLKYFISWELKGWLASVNYQFTDLRYVNPENTTFLAAYDLLDVYLQRQLVVNNKHKILFRFGVENALNNEYEAVLSRPMPGINYSFKIGYEL